MSYCFGVWDLLRGVQFWRIKLFFLGLLNVLPNHLSPFNWVVSGDAIDIFFFLTGESFRWSILLPPPLDFSSFPFLGNRESLRLLTVQCFTRSKFDFGIWVGLVYTNIDFFSFLRIINNKPINLVGKKINQTIFFFWKKQVPRYGLHTWTLMIKLWNL